MRTVFLLLILAGISRADNPPGVPADYKLQYSQDFAKPESLKDFTFTDPKIWRLAKEGDKPYLELFKDKGDYNPKFRSPFLVALLKDKQFEDVIFEAECLQTGAEVPHRDMVFVYGYQSPTKFYYTHVASKADDHANNCFIVNEAPRVKFAKDVSAGVKWGQNIWHKVRVERKASDGTVKIWFDDMEKPIMQANDKTFGPGAIGFGSFDDMGKLTNIKVWSKAMTTNKTEAFPETKAEPKKEAPKKK